MSPRLLLAIDVAIGCAAAALLVPAAMLLLQAVCAVLPRRRTPAARPLRRPSVAVLIPAHDEQRHLPAAIDAIRPQLEPGDRIVVVADNCTDATAELAASLGAHVVQRFDAARRGKGYALDSGIRSLAAQPPEVVVVVDADCCLHSGSLDVLARRCGELGRPIQACYLMQAQANAGLPHRFAEFAWTVKNHARPRGMAALGGPCQLMGSGMALPWRLVEAAPLASSCLVEDLQLGLELARCGHAPCFCEDALVTSRFPRRDEARRAQNRRWDHGHLATLAGQGGPLMSLAIRRRDVALAALVLDLAIPPLALLLLATGAAAAAAGLLAAAGAPAWPARVALAGLAAMVVSIGACWVGFGRRSVSLPELMLAPAYAVGKVPTYVSAVWARQTRWVRADRDD